MFRSLPAVLVLAVARLCPTSPTQSSDMCCLFPPENRTLLLYSFHQTCLPRPLGSLLRPLTSFSLSCGRTCALTVSPPPHT